MGKIIEVIYTLEDSNWSRDCIVDEIDDKDNSCIFKFKIVPNRNIISQRVMIPRISFDIDQLQVKREYLLVSIEDKSSYIMRPYVSVKLVDTRIIDKALSFDGHLFNLNSTTITVSDSRFFNLSFF